MRKLIFALALGAIFIPNLGLTLGLGEIEVNSSLNQKLVARIDLISAIPEDAESLLIKLATRKEFVRAGLDRPMVLASLKFKAVVEGSQVYIDVMSPKPIREPFLNFLVEVDWPKGHLIREYTILLDPPTFMGGRQKAASASGRPAMRASTSRAPVNIQSAAESSRPGMQSAAAVEPMAAEVYTAEAEPEQQQASYATTSYTAPTEHRVVKGDTAWSLANRTKPDDSISTQQMMLAMLRLNPEAFIDGNVNALKRGFILRTPDYDDINAVSYEEAKAIVAQQNALWREYQQSLSSDQPAPAVDQPAPAVEENHNETKHSSATGGMKDGSRLSIVSAGDGSSASGEMAGPSDQVLNELQEQLAVMRENIETERVEKEALQQQVDALNTQVDKMKGLMTIQDDAMAEIQSVGAADEAALPLDNASDKMAIEDVTAESNVAVEEPALDQDAASALDALTDLFKSEPAVEDLQQEQVAEEVAPAVEEVAPIVEEAKDVDLAVDELFADEAQQAAETTAEAVTELEMLDTMEPIADTQPQEKSLIDTLLDYRLIVLGLLVALLIIAAIVYLIKRGRRNSSSGAVSDDDIFNTSGDDFDGIADLIDDESMDDLVSDEEVQAAMAETVAEVKVKEEAFDADATMILPSGTDTVVTPAAKSAPKEAEEQDDVLAEADVYLAYGIYQQAEELLENAIKENPDKDSYRVKLAETYFAGKNAEAFAKLGVEMKAIVGNTETPAWAKVVAMGKELCPDEDVFQQAEMDASLDVNDLMPKSPEPMDLDLGDDSAAEELDLDFDSPLDDAEFELPSMDETAVISPDETAIMSAETDSFDEVEFDLSETEAVEAPAAEEEFSLDIDASELDFGETEVVEEPAAEEEFSLDIGASDSAGEGLDAELDMDMGMDLDIDMGASDSAGEGLDAELDMDMGMDLDIDMGELDMAVESEPEPVSENVDDGMDLGLDMSIDDEEGEIDLTDAASDLGLSADDDFGDMDLSEPLDAEEVSTQLDLARAYIDMGDHEGARDILEEVVTGGNAEQKKEAEKLMAQAS